MKPRFPIYIVSKGRHDSRMTAKALIAMGVPFRIVVEEQEVDAYAAVLPRESIVTLDRQYQLDYDACDDLGMEKSKGPGPARNFAWAHSVREGHSHHWVMDDNITRFSRLNGNKISPVVDGAIFRAMEDFCLRYRNVAMAGPNYETFGSRQARLPGRMTVKDRGRLVPPFVMNTRIYSCNLIRNDVPFRWRGRYNEDTDLSLQMLKAGWCTVQFNAFLQDKVNTQSVKGGNTDAFYAKEGTLPKSLMQVKLHPDCSRLVFKFGRAHHTVDYKRFKQKLVLRDGVTVPDGVDEYGMVYVDAQRKLGR